MFHAILDTNIIISAFIKRHSIPGFVLNSAIKGKIIPVIHPDILQEYYNVLHRPKFKFCESEISSFFEDIKKRAVVISPLSYPFPLPDESDRIFLETTLSARKQFKDAFLVTGNKKHFPKEDFILSPQEMKKIIKQR